MDILILDTRFVTPISRKRSIDHMNNAYDDDLHHHLQKELISFVCKEIKSRINLTTARNIHGRDSGRFAVIRISEKASTFLITPAQDIRSIHLVLKKLEEEVKGYGNDFNDSELDIPSTETARYLVEPLLLECVAIEQCIRYVKENPSFGKILFLSTNINNETITESSHEAKFISLMQNLDCVSETCFVSCISVDDDLIQANQDRNKFQHIISIMNNTTHSLVHVTSAAIWKLIARLPNPTQDIRRCLLQLPSLNIESKQKEEPLEIEVDLLTLNPKLKTVRKMSICKCHAQPTLEYFVGKGSKHTCQISHRKLRVENCKPALQLGQKVVFLPHDLFFKATDQNNIILSAINIIDMNTFSIGLLSGEPFMLKSCTNLSLQYEHIKKARITWIFLLAQLRKDHTGIIMSSIDVIQSNPNNYDNHQETPRKRSYYLLTPDIYSTDRAILMEVANRESCQLVGATMEDSVVEIFESKEDDNKLKEKLQSSLNVLGDIIPFNPLKYSTQFHDHVEMMLTTGKDQSEFKIENAPKALSKSKTTSKNIQHTTTSITNNNNTNRSKLTVTLT